MGIGNNDPIEVILYTIYSRSTKKTTPTPVRKPQVKVRCYTARYPVLGIVNVLTIEVPRVMVIIQVTIQW